MLNSLAAQVDYYSTLLRHHKGWEYIGVYADEAKTGTKDTRENFQRRAVIDILSADDPIPLEFDRMLYRSTVEKIVVKRDDTIEFHMAGGKVYVRSVH